MPPSLDVTVPVPVPVVVTVSVCAMPKLAVTVWWPLIVIVHTFPVAAQPVHASKTYPEPAEAVSTTVVPLAYDCVQSPGQAMPAGLEVTEPLPDVVVVSV